MENQYAHKSNRVVYQRGKNKRLCSRIGLQGISDSARICPVSDSKPVALHIENVGDRTLVLSGEAEFTLMIPCDRCLEPVEVPFQLSIERTLDMNLTDEERIADLDEQPYLQGYNLDVDQLVRDELLLNLPMKVLCDEDCKGICNRCGANLNHETCDCDRSSLDPRMSVIQDIFKQFKEV